MATIINGSSLALKIRQNLKIQIQEELINKGKSAPCLAVVLVGDNPASKIYVAGKIKACEELGIKSEAVKFDYDISQQTLNKAIKELNKNKNVHGILLQLPLPYGLNATEAINLIAPEKDVDGLCNTNLGKLLSGDCSAIKSCTPSGVMEMFKEYNIDLKGKNVALINRSLLVGKPLAVMLTACDATVTICHSKTQKLESILKRSDVIISAVGIKNFVKAEMVKKGAVVIDVGIVRDEKTNKICGDIDYEKVKDLASYITPVPGGVGPMTIAMLLKNTVDTAINQIK